MSERSSGLDDTGEVAITPELSALERTLPARKGAEGVTRETREAGALDAAFDATSPSGLPKASGALERYKLLEEVGQGGMAVVYRAHDTTLDREVAVKVLHPHLAGQVESRDRLEREAHAVAKLRHENILEIFDYSGRGSDKSFIVTEFIHGTTLRGFMQAQPLPHPEIAELIVSEVARALGHAHHMGIIHRDIKPENVMIRNDGVLKLTDFGIAQIVDKERMTVTGQLLGSPAYMAPEHVDGTGIDIRTDVFAVGILLYQLATGELPFRGKNPHEVLKKIAECTYTPADAMNPRVGRRLNQVIARALAKDKAARYPDLGEMRRELLDDLAEAGIHEPRAELARLFVEPKSYIPELGPRLVAGFTTRGIALKAAGRRAAALELWRRALEITPGSGELLALIAGAERQRIFVGIAGAIVGLAAIGIGVAYAIPAYHAYRLLHPKATIAIAPPIAPPITPPVVVTELPTTDPAGRVVATPTPRHTERIRQAPTFPPATVEPARHAMRKFELVPTPKNVRVLVDGKALGDYGPALMQIELDDRPHTVTFENPACYPEIMEIPADAPSGRLSRRLKFKPATLTVDADPADADILIDGRLIARSGRAIPITLDSDSDGRRKVRVKVSAAGRESEEHTVELRASGAETLDVHLKPGGGAP